MRERFELVLRVGLIAVAAMMTVAATAQAHTDAADESDPDTPESPDTRITANGDFATQSELDTGDIFRLDPVIVTARKWSESAQDTPISMRILDHSFLESAGATTIREASFYVPNLHIQEFTARRLSFPTIRGIGSGIGDPAVVTYIDGVPQLSSSSTNLPLQSIERIEFLRGPQSTLYGRSAIGGVINLYTQKPSNTPTVHASSGFGNYDALDFSLGYSGPLIADNAYISIEGSHSERDGFTNNSVTGHDIDSRESQFGRAQILITPDDQNEVRFTIHGERARDGGFALFDVPSLRAKSHTVAQDFEGRTERDLVQASVTWNHYGDAIDFTSITSYTSFDILETADFDFTALDAVRRRTDEQQRYFYQEVRLSSAQDSPVELADGIDLRWLVGASLFSSDSDREASNTFRPGGAGILFPITSVGVDTQAGSFNDVGLAAFGQTTVTFGDKLDLTAGLRIDYENKEATVARTFAGPATGGFAVPVSGASLDKNFTEFLPSFSAAYRFNDDLMVYGSAARGFRAGGFNIAAPTDRLAYGPERSWTFEAGVKSLWWEDRVGLNASVFYIDWDNIQLSLFDPSIGGFIDNATDATSKGFEIELFARPTEGLDIFAGVGLTDTELGGFVDQFGVDVSGNKLANVPELTWNVGAQFTGTVTKNIDWFVRAEYIDVGEYYFDAGNRNGDRYALLNFRAGIEINDNLRIEGWVRNALDDEFILVAFQPSPADPTVFVGENGAPLTYGFRVSLTF